MALAAAAVELTGEPAPSGLTGFPGSKFTLGDPDSTSRALVGVVFRMITTSFSTPSSVTSPRRGSVRCWAVNKEQPL